MQELKKVAEKVKEVYHGETQKSEKEAAETEKSKASEHLGKAFKPGEGGSMTEELSKAKAHYTGGTEHEKKATEAQEKSGAAAKKAEEGHA